MCHLSTNLYARYMFIPLAVVPALGARHLLSRPAAAPRAPIHGACTRMCINMCMYIYIYIYRERERGYVCVYIYIYIYTHMHIYIYI